jgi:oligopeptide/dipeptide ABC transporter ATP-binding protein
MAEQLLQLDNVTKTFTRATGLGVGGRKTVQALDNVSLSLPDKPQVCALVGESGSGKTTLCRIVIGLEQATGGSVRFRGREVRDWLRKDMKEYRRQVQVIFQDPYATYNPFYRVDRVLKSVVRNFHLAANGREGTRIITEALEAIGLRPREILGRYPHQLSGGERQRIMLARIYLLRPKLLVADEPVSMLDASLRAMFLEHLQSFRNLGVSCLYITHDLNVGYFIADQILILCLGRMVEWGKADHIVNDPLHPYTRELISSIPNPDPQKRWTERLRAERIGLNELRRASTGAGCIYAQRCPHVMEKCRRNDPPLKRVKGREGDEREVACFLYE